LSGWPERCGSFVVLFDPQFRLTLFLTESLDCLIVNVHIAASLQFCSCAARIKSQLLCLPELEPVSPAPPSASGVGPSRPERTNAGSKNYLFAGPDKGGKMKLLDQSLAQGGSDGRQRHSCWDADGVVGQDPIQLLHSISDNRMIEKGWKF
jgi:hypothetical protein